MVFLIIGQLLQGDCIRKRHDLCGRATLCAWIGDDWQERAAAGLRLLQTIVSVWPFLAMVLSYLIDCCFPYVKISQHSKAFMERKLKQSNSVLSV